MYRYFKGVLTELTETFLVVEVDDIGYQLAISRKDAEYFRPFINQDVTVYVYLHVKEDEHSLYGFSSAQIKDVFLILISISGIGPKSGLGILSELSVSQLITAILSNDLVALTSVSGIGKKTAERMVLELKDKFKNLDFAVDLSGNTSVKISPALEQEALQALISLGYNQGEVRRMIAVIKPDLKPEATTKDIITLALKFKSKL